MSASRPAPRRRPTVQITDRDRRLLAFVADHRFVLAGHVGKLLGISAGSASARLRSLRGGGYLVSDQPLRDQPTHYQVTGPGLRAIGSDLPRPRAVDLSVHRHEVGVAWLAVGAHRGMFGPVSDIVSERRMRSHDGRVTGRDERFGVRLGGIGGIGGIGGVGAAGGIGARHRLHYPDLLLVTASGRRVAFELELTTKGPRRREAILAAYAADRRIDGVVYVVQRPEARRALERSVRRLGIGDRVRIEQVELGGGAVVAPATRAARRAAGRDPHGQEPRARDPQGREPRTAGPEAAR